MKYRIRYSDSALEDIRNLRFIIRDTYKAPLTAIHYLQGLYDEIKRLAVMAESLPVQQSESLLRFGKNVRRINYSSFASAFVIVATQTEPFRCFVGDPAFAMSVKRGAV
ncbi:MAG TPA: hypothetical protein DDZ96_14240 [Porphyromonadaceae bacterium]|mgnify:CR=1 FL=1|jgi:plasmid stabilization system protein ParE|nr:hypothetical protein [Porphyromonadaceae bacterium]